MYKIYFTNKAGTVHAVMAVCDDESVTVEMDGNVKTFHEYRHQYDNLNCANDYIFRIIPDSIGGVRREYKWDSYDGFSDYISDLESVEHQADLAGDAETYWEAIQAARDANRAFYASAPET